MSTRVQEDSSSTYLWRLAVHAWVRLVECADDDGVGLIVSHTSHTHTLSSNISRLLATSSRRAAARAVNHASAAVHQACLRHAGGAGTQRCRRGGAVCRQLQLACVVRRTSAAAGTVAATAGWRPAARVQQQALGALQEEQRVAAVARATRKHLLQGG